MLSSRWVIEHGSFTRITRCLDGVVQNIHVASTDEVGSESLSISGRGSKIITVSRPPAQQHVNKLWSNELREPSTVGRDRDKSSKRNDRLISSFALKIVPP